jgi:hypothetical protein
MSEKFLGEQFPPVKAPSFYDGDYSFGQTKPDTQFVSGVAVGCGVVAVLVLFLAVVGLLAVIL